MRRKRSKRIISINIKEGSIMTVLELFTILQPLIIFLGSLCMIVLIACGILFTITWLIKKLWKIILTFCTISFFLAVAVLILNAMWHTEKRGLTASLLWCGQLRLDLHFSPSEKTMDIFSVEQFRSGQFTADGQLSVHKRHKRIVNKLLKFS